MRVLLVVLAVGLAHPAFALSGAEVWRQWQAVMAGDGWVLKQGAVTDLPDGIRVADIVAAHDSGATVSLSEVTISDAPGADVRIAFGPQLQVFWPQMVQPGVQIDSTGAVLLSSPQTGGKGFTFAADSLALKAADAGDSPAAQIALTTVTGRFAMAAADSSQMIPVEMALNAAEMRFTLRDDRDPLKKVTLDSTVPGLDFQLSARMPQAMTRSNAMTTAQEFAAGFSFDLTAKHGAIDAQVQSGLDRIALNGLPCTHGLAMAQSGFSLRGDCGSGQLRVTGPNLPAEAVVSLQKLLMQISAPVDSMAAPANLNVIVTLEDAALNDQIWALIDTQKALPHDPMDFALDLGLLARWNIFDDRTTESFKPEAVDLRRFNLKAAGVEAAFSGHGTVDPAAGPDASPFTEAVLDGKVSGLNRLLNALIEAGIVAQGDMFPIRMGLSMIFNPAPGEDVLTTHVEARAGGSVFVNGVQMK